MDQELTRLASAAASELVKLLTTDAWHGAKDAITALWKRARPDNAAAIEAELVASRDRLLTDPEASARLSALWRDRLVTLLAREPALAGELRAILMSPQGQERNVSVQLQARVSGAGRVYQAGRDQAIHQR